ncbi:hypothetical protein [Agromyces sp. SYSU T00266]|uniref:hypothetical protein n=1 Tax=Agromyces zhanjiangensis TaxID=3158562 RepID=UPI003396388B
MTKRVDADTSVLSYHERIEYQRLLDEASKNGPLPDASARRLKTVGWVYATILAVCIAAAGIVGYAMYGTGFSVGAAMCVAFTLGCLFGVAHEIQTAFAVDRFRKDRLQRADAYLQQKRVERQQHRTAHASRGDDIPFWWVEGYDHSRHHGRFSRSDRAYMNEHGMDADTYISNVLENDKD